MTDHVGKRRLVTVTGRRECDHIIGMLEASFPQYGETDRLVRDGEEASIYFSSCPLCGHSLPYHIFHDKAKDNVGQGNQFLSQRV